MFKNKMKQLLFFTIISLIHLTVNSQSQQLEKQFIWNTLYPNNKSFDNENLLIRKIKRDNEEIKVRTKIENIFYYKVGTLQKAAVILYSYKYDEYLEDIRNCHPCSPEFEIATFTLLTNNWTKQRFIQNWEAGGGSWGESWEVKFQVFNKKDCLLVVNLGYTHKGESTDGYYEYYDIETLNFLKGIKIKYTP